MTKVEFCQNVCEGLLTIKGIDSILNKSWVLSKHLWKCTYNIRYWLRLQCKSSFARMCMKVYLHHTVLTPSSWTLTSSTSISTSPSTETSITPEPSIVTTMCFTWKDAQLSGAAFHVKYILVTMNGLEAIDVSVSAIGSDDIVFKFCRNVCEGLLATYGIDTIFNNIWV